MKSPVLLALATLLLPGGVAHADLKVALGNDTLSEAVPPMDDDGFTNDIDIRLWRPRGVYLVGGRIYDRWVTEVPRVAGRRRDLLELQATIDRTWGEPRERALAIGLRLGPVFTGNLGGRWGQNAFHWLCRCGDLLDEGLQRRYEGDREAGALLGTRVQGTAGRPIAHAYAVIDGQLAVGTGVSWLEAGVGGGTIGRVGRTELGARLEVLGMQFHVADDGLAIPGGYRPGRQAAFRVGLHVAWSRYQLEYQYRANEGGSGEPIGVVSFTIKQRMPTSSVRGHAQAAY